MLNIQQVSPGLLKAYKLGFKSQEPSKPGQDVKIVQTYPVPTFPSLINPTLQAPTLPANFDAIIADVDARGGEQLRQFVMAATERWDDINKKRPHTAEENVHAERDFQLALHFSQIAPNPVTRTLIPFLANRGLGVIYERTGHFLEAAKHYQQTSDTAGEYQLTNHNHSSAADFAEERAHWLEKAAHAMRSAGQPKVAQSLLAQGVSVLGGGSLMDAMNEGDGRRIGLHQQIQKLKRKH